RIAARRAMLLVTFRPEFQAPWVGRPQVTSLVVNRLTVHESRAMIDRIVGNRVLSEAIRQEIIARTDGIPLFVEEMTKAGLEAGGEMAANRPIAAIPAPARAVPPSLHASLMARLDWLGGPARELAQVAAVIGREFSHALLSAVMGKPDAELDAAIERLIGSG